MILGTRFAPLWPAGHLPHRWGDWLGAPVSSNSERCYSANCQFGGKTMPLVISPPVGEMAGGPEGGVLAPAFNGRI